MQDLDIILDSNIHLNCISICDDCNDIILFPQYEEDYILCKNCISDLIFCSDCNDAILYNSDDFYELNNSDIICESCYDENYFTCHNCEEVYKSEDEINDVNGDNYCNDCYHDLYIECHNCEEIILRNNSCTNNITDYYYCENCYNDIFCICEDCSDDIFSEDTYRSEYDCNLCDGCYESREENNNNHIHEYGFRPDLTFYTLSKNFDYCDENYLFLGVELEIDGENINNREFLESNEEFLNNQPFYFCRDGSLDKGFEIITHPCTLSYHEAKIEYNQLFKLAKHANYKSHDYKTCGLHVHINKSYLGNNIEEIDVNISKILIFYERSWNSIIKFSRRTPEQYNHWCKNYRKSSDNEEQIKDLLYTAKNSDRYYAVNLNNSKTIEFRVFRGTLILNSFYATLEFVESSVNFIMQIDLSEHYKINWYNYIKYVDQNKELYSDLIEYLKEKNLYNI